MVRRWFGSLATAAAVSCVALVLAAQSARVPELGVGKLLVAKRDTKDQIFGETVILLIRYDHTGTVGLVINRRTKLPISKALDPLKRAIGRSDPVYIGGPVEGENVLALLRAKTMPEGAAHVTGKVYLIPSAELLDKTLAGRPDSGDFHVYLGYCGWGPGQLENEASHGVWQVLSGNADAVFDADPESLWSRLIERAEQRVARAY
jgi:putative transcriptional regulator